MARTSKYDINKAQSSIIIWKAGLYRRLSKDDINKQNFNDSDSIESQKYIQEDFLSSYEDIEVIDEYIDDGFTGGDEDRPDFQRMLADLKSKKINCIVVKDLSRFTRSEIAQLQFTQVDFAKSGIRFIAILDRVDSILEPDSVHSPKTKMKGMKNENLLRDTSRKVRSILNMKREEGEFIGAFASYGYCKDINNHNKLVIDSEISENVKTIYKWFMDGLSLRGIAIKLNKLGIPNPAKYKKLKGMKYRGPYTHINDGLWVPETIRRILCNRIYIGDMIQGQRRKVSYKVKNFIQVPENEWFIKEATHEAIIDKDTFNTVQSLLKRDTRTSPNKRELAIFAGFLKCADCGRAMVKKIPNNPKLNYNYYVCRTYEKMPGGKCTRHSIRSDILEKLVLNALIQQIEISVNMNKAIIKINNSPKVLGATDYLNHSIKIYENDKERLKIKVRELYPEYKDGFMTKENYFIYKEKYENELEIINARLLELYNQLEKEKNGIDDTNSFVQHFIKYKGFKVLTREMLAELVENINIKEGKGIEVEFKFADAYRSAVAFIEKNNISELQQIFNYISLESETANNSAVKEA